MKKDTPLCYLNEKGEESHAFFIANSKDEPTLTLSAVKQNKNKDAFFSVPKYLVYEPNHAFEKKNAQLFFEIDTNIVKQENSKDDTHVNKSVFDDVTLESIKHTYKVLNTPGFARPILGAKKRASKNIVDLAEKLNLKILIDGINATGIMFFDKGLTEQELNNAEKMASKIDVFLREEIKNNPNAKAAFISKNIVDTLGTSAHYAIKLNNLITTSLAGTIQNKIADTLNIPNSETTLEDRTINLSRSLVDKWVSESLKNSNSGIVQEFSKALDSQFKANFTNVPLHIFEKRNNKAKGLFLYSQVMLINKLKTFEKTLDETLGHSKLQRFASSPALTSLSKRKKTEVANKGLENLNEEMLDAALEVRKLQRPALTPDLNNSNKRLKTRTVNQEELEPKVKELCKEKLNSMSTPTVKLKKPLSTPDLNSLSKKQNNNKKINRSKSIAF